MTTWIALFRGINVGGKNTIPMATLKRDLESLNLNQVQTYIQSGNVIFDSAVRSEAALRKSITEKLAKQHKLVCDVLLLKSSQLKNAILGNPFRHAESEPASLHFFFLTAPADHADFQYLDSVLSISEQYKLVGSVVYLHAPDGIGRSKFAANLERGLGVKTTARNFRTVEKLHLMLNERRD